MSAVEQARERLMRQVREYGILCVDTYRGLTLNKNPLKSQAMADLSERLDAYAAAVRAERDAAWREGMNTMASSCGSGGRNGQPPCCVSVDALAARMEAK